jgi:hypothetical protein
MQWFVGCPITMKPGFIRPNRAKFLVLAVTMPVPPGAVIFIFWPRDNPVKYTDPDGREKRKPGLLLGMSAHLDIQHALIKEYKGSSPLYLSNPSGGRKGAYFVDCYGKNSSGKTEFYEIKPVSYMSNRKGITN